MRHGFCAIDKAALCGTCAATPAAGDACTTSGCGPTMRCVAQSQLCEVPVASGGACGRGMPCADGLACVGATMMMVNGTCTAQLVTAGATCDPQRKIDADCNPDLGARVRQRDQRVRRAAGRRAGWRVRCPRHASRPGAATGEACTITTGQTGTCAAPAADGAACDATAGPSCQFPARCVGDVCALPGSISC